MKYSNEMIIFVVLAIAVIVLAVAINRGEKFAIFPSFNRVSAPYYTTTFQAYPGKYMHFGSNRNYECLQRNMEYSAYRNCMLYLE